jgi:tetratricopeptide (TPR) repeat protein
MKCTFKKVATLSVLGTLMACAQTMKLSPPLSQGPVAGLKGQTTKTEPQLSVAPTAFSVPILIANAPGLAPDAPSSQAVYLQGRAAHGQGHLAQATEHYEQVLQLDPRHVGALNALGVIHAQEGRTQEALALFTRAISLAPEVPHLYNNIGYALLRADRLDEAGLQLKRAQELSPASMQLLQNMELLAQAKRDAAAKIATTSEANTEASQPGARLVAIAPQIYELQTTVPQQAVQPMEPPANAIQTAKPTLQQTTVENVAKKPQEDELVTETAPTIPTASTPAESSPDRLRGVQLEVANGVGISHLARRTADRLASTGVNTVRLTDAKPYRQMKTEIQFGAGQKEAAKALQARLPFSTINSVSPSQLRTGLQLRLVLGHDMKGQAIAAWLESQEVRMALNPSTLPGDVTTHATAGRS